MLSTNIISTIPIFDIVFDNLIDDEIGILSLKFADRDINRKWRTEIFCCFFQCLLPQCKKMCRLATTAISEVKDMLPVGGRDLGFQLRSDFVKNRFLIEFGASVQDQLPEDTFLADNLEQPLDLL